MSAQKSILNVVMGAMTFGAEGQEGARVHDIKDVEAILDAFQAHGHTEVDTARVYAGGTSEEYLGRVDHRGRGLKIETKLVPWRSHGFSHDPEGLRKHLLASKKALNIDTLEIWYLHAPDRTVPYEVTMKAVDELFKEGHFKRFGISNYAAWEVAEIVGICKANGYILPTVYQGIYNAIHRNVEPELFPCLRKFGIAFYEFNPLAGGFFTDRYLSPDGLSPDGQPEKGSRFDPERTQGKAYRDRYWNDAYFGALTSIKKVADDHKLTLAEISLRWVTNHSLMKREYGDAILIGASSLKHIEQNLVDLEKGPLPEDVVKALDDAWFKVKPYATKYYH
ncbi:Aldo/keto reductase [Pleurotus eryngii]|uniref:Aldo/keto reductase n=1 Tax=Pleurotus eryngii TaxID=5323 RepID=A0A9P6A771_PLEER|nr:Aldo/keto reductase [Pleurotus eryngii]